VASWIAAPLNRLLPATARHLPLIFSRPPGVRLHFWPCAALHPGMTTSGAGRARSCPGRPGHVPETEEITGRPAASRTGGGPPVAIPAHVDRPAVAAPGAVGTVLLRGLASWPPARSAHPGWRPTRTPAAPPSHPTPQALAVDAQLARPPGCRAHVGPLLGREPLQFQITQSACPRARCCGCRAGTGRRWRAGPRRARGAVGQLAQRHDLELTERCCGALVGSGDRDRGTCR